MDQVCLNTQRHRKTKALALLSLVLVFAVFFAFLTDIPVFAYSQKLVDNDDAQGGGNTRQNR